jgi:DNA polymerase-3 subunit delta
MEDRIRSAKAGSVFLVCGTEQFQICRIRAAARVRFCDGLGFEYSTLSADEAETGRISRILGEPSLFAPGRLLRLSEADRMPAATRRELTELAGRGGSQDAILVESTETSLRNAFNAGIDRIQGAVSFVCWDPFERDFARWCDTLCREKGLSLPAGSRSVLISWAAGSLTRLDDTSPRASLFAAGRALEPSDLAGLLTGVADSAVFDLSDEIWAGRPGRALSIAWRLIQAGEEPVALLALIGRQWEKLEAARTIVSSGGGSKDVERELGIPASAASSLITCAKSSKTRPVWVCAELLASSDQSLKTGADPFTVFASLIHSLTPD